MAMVNGSSLPRNNGGAIDRMDERHNSIDQTKGGESRPILRGHESEEQELIFPELWQIPSREFDDDRVHGTKTHRRPRSYGHDLNQGIKFPHSGEDVHLQYDRHNSNDLHRGRHQDRPIGHHDGGFSSHVPIGHHDSGLGSYDRPIGHHDGGFGSHDPIGHHDVGFGSHGRPVGHHGGGHGIGGGYEPHHNTHATESRYDRKY